MIPPGLSHIRPAFHHHATPRQMPLYWPEWLGLNPLHHPVKEHMLNPLTVSLLILSRASLMESGTKWNSSSLLQDGTGQLPVFQILPGQL